MENLTPLWGQLEAEALVLSSEAESLPLVINAFEARLAGFDLGIESRIELAHREVSGFRDEVDVQDVTTFLRFCWANGQWGLWVQEVCSDGERQPVLEGPIRRLADCPRNVQIDAISRFSALLTSLEREAQSKTKTIRSAKTQLGMGSA